MLRRCLAEFVATFGLVFVSAGVVMADAFSGGAVGHLAISLAPGLMVAAMIYATGHICGAHMNPAITLAFALSDRFPWRDVPVYWAVQFAAGIAAGLALRGIMGEVGAMGATLPSVDLFRSAAVEFGLTFFLALVVMAVATDSRAEGPGAAFAIGGIVALEIMVAGPVSGASMNPARSLGPALAALNWEAHWIYWVGPIAGAAVAALFYRFVRQPEPAEDQAVPKIVPEVVSGAVPEPLPSQAADPVPGED